MKLIFMNTDRIATLFSLIFLTVLTSCESSGFEESVDNTESLHLKGNVESVVKVTYSGNPLEDCEPIECSCAWDVIYWEFDDKGFLTSAISWNVPIDNCKEFSFVAWNAEGNPLEYIHWDNNYISSKISHFKYSYNFDGVLTDTDDEMYDWLLHYKSKPVTKAEMINDVSGYQFIVSLEDTIGAIKFNKDNGLSEFIHYAHKDGNKYELKYNVKSVEEYHSYLESGKVKKKTWKDDKDFSEQTFEYQGNKVVRAVAKEKNKHSITEYENGHATTTKTYDSGNNLISTSEFTFKGNIIKGDGSYKVVTKETSGKESSAEYFYKDGQVVKQVIHNDSTYITNISYNDNGDVLLVDYGSGKEYSKYEYDKKGNWVVCRKYNEKDELITVEKRLIKYRK